MKDLLFEGIEDLAAGLGIYVAIATASAIVQIVFGGWRGFRHALSILCVALLVGVMAGWACQYYQIPWLATAVIIGGATLLSNTIMEILFHPAIRDAIVQYVINEISKRSKNKKGGTE